LPVCRGIEKTPLTTPTPLEKYQRTMRKGHTSPAFPKPKYSGFGPAMGGGFADFQGMRRSRNYLSCR
ncbi:MAG: hypothetical protein ACODAD_03540, partial [Planctomycetota bacterium]